jgi:hypothetical protein
MKMNICIHVHELPQLKFKIMRTNDSLISKAIIDLIVTSILQEIIRLPLLSIPFCHLSISRLSYHYGYDYRFSHCFLLHIGSTPTYCIDPLVLSVVNARAAKCFTGIFVYTIYIEQCICRQTCKWICGYIYVWTYFYRYIHK